MGEALENNYIEAQAFFNKIKQILLGQSIEQILCEPDLNKKQNSKLLSEYLIDQSKKFYSDSNKIYCENMQGGKIILKIAGQQIEFEL